jgi:hypothetical protein
MTLNASQNVGIGTSSPATKLNIVDASATVNVQLESGSVIGQFFSSTPAGGVFLGSSSAHPLVFRTDTTERMRIDSSGNVGIGTISPGTKLNVVTAGADVEIRATTTTSGDVRVGFDASGAFYNWIQTDRSSGTMRFATANTEQARITTAGLFQFNSGFGSVSTVYGCRAWANFDGTLSSPITPRASGNIGSITKSATGIYQVNFTNNMPDANYSVSAIGSRNTTATTNNVATQVVDGTLSVSSFQVFNERSNDGAQVDANMCVAVFR